MNAYTRNIRGVFQSSSLMVIPYYQRRYVWGKENWERFFKDMTETVDSSSNYFLGALILKKMEPTQEDRNNSISNKSIVVDGQQRLTTLAIFMKILHFLNDDKQRNYFNAYYLQDDGNKSPVIKHNLEDAPAFEEIMHLETLQSCDAKQGNIWEAYKFFLEKLRGYSRYGNLKSLLSSIYSRVNFVLILLDASDDEQRIFDTLNSLGVDLTTDELLKNYLYSVEDENKYRNNWRPIFDTDEARKYWCIDASTVRQSRRNTILDRFLHAFVLMKMWDFKNKLTAADRKEFVKIESAYNACKAFCERFGMSKLALADEIIECAKIYKKNINPEFLEQRLPMAPCIQRISVLAQGLGSYVTLPYLLYVLKNVQSEVERNKIFGYLETYLIRRLANNSSSKNYSDLFAENLIGNRILSYEQLRTYISNRDDGSSLEMPSYADLSMGIKSHKIKSDIAKMVLYLYETKIQDSTSFPYAFNECTTDSLMPSKKTNAWSVPANIDNTTLKVQTSLLGNMFLLAPYGDDYKKGLNEIKNSAFAKKASYYQSKGQGVRTQQYLTNKTGWTLDDITNRCDSLATAIDRLWPVPNN